MNTPPVAPRSFWFPFTWTEVEIGLALASAVGASLSLAAVRPPLIVSSVAVSLSVLYLAGLLVYSNRRARTFDFIEDGGIRGDGHVPYFKAAQRSVFLTHADDDAPSEELLAIYRRLLDRGVEMRRVLFLRDGGEGASWVARFGDHPHLVQRIIPPFRATLMRFSFVVIDEHTVILSVPGSGPLDCGSYTRGLVLRHLLVIRDPVVVKVFLRMHRDLWAQAENLGSAAELAGSTGVVSWMTARFPQRERLSRILEREE